MNPAQIEIIKATAAVVAPRALDITKTFYPKMFAGNPEVLQFFNVANQKTTRQPNALADAVVAYASNIDNLSVLGSAVERMVHKHVALQVMPEHYPIVAKHLMAAVGEVLGDVVTPEIADAWEASVLQLAGILIDEENKLRDALEKAPNGWRGWKSFKVQKKTAYGSGESLTHLRLVPNEGKMMDAAPGQYATLRFDESSLYPENTPDHVAPRHYSVVSHDADGFDVCVRHVDGGLYSSYIANTLKEGDDIQVAAPVGVFTYKNTPQNVYLAGGVGFTPLIPMAKKGNGLFIHASHRTTDFDASNALMGGVKPIHQMLTERTVGLDMNKVTQTVVDEFGDIHSPNYYLCGPPGMIQSVGKSLLNSGVPESSVHYELFGPHMSIE